MKMSMRWYGQDDAIPLQYIQQIPAMQGVVSALYDVPMGQVWPLDRLAALKEEIEQAGLLFTCIESIPVHESIKLGLPERDALIENYCQSIRHAGQLGIPIVCYNFMPIFDWMRTDLEMVAADGSTRLSFVQEDLLNIDLKGGSQNIPGVESIPGWKDAYTAEDLQQLLKQYEPIGEAELQANLRYFLENVIPVAEESGVLMAIHPDDPPWSIFGLPRIVSRAEQIRAILDAVPSLHNGLTFCTGSLGASPQNDLPEMIREFGERIHFVHMRNVKRTSKQTFHETEHPSTFGDVDMFEVMQALMETGFSGPIRPDHGRMIWGETGRAGYGLYDRALGAVYLHGLREGIQKSKRG